MHDFKADTIVYIPRSDSEVILDLKEGKIPLEIKEQLRLVDKIPEPLENKVKEIVQRILDKNGLKGPRYELEIQVFSHPNDNASTMTSAKKPLLNLSTGLLINVSTEDELAGVIAHEIGHIVLDEACKEADHHNKVEESAADALGVKLLGKAGYDPKKLIYFFQRVGGSESHLINLDSVKDADSMDEAKGFFAKIMDEHPAEDNRIRAMETTITALVRNATIRSFKGSATPLPAEFNALAKTISYMSPLQTGLKDIDFTNKPILDQMAILTALLKQLYPVSNYTSEKRMLEIASMIKELSVDFTHVEQKQAFIELADVLMIKYPKEIKINAIKSKTVEKVIDALKLVWKKGGKDPRFLARHEVFKLAVDNFIAADTAQKAEDAAADICLLANELDLVHSPCVLSGLNRFPVLDEDEMREILKAEGQWIPPYAKHLQWYLAHKSENIKNVLLSMNSYLDPMIKEALGTSTSPLEWQDHDLPTIYGNELDQIAKRADSSFCKLIFRRADTRFFKRLERNQEGTVVGFLKQVPGYTWKYLDTEASKEEIIANDAQEVEHRRQYEEKLMYSIDWSLLKQDFPNFIALYGALLQWQYSFTPIQSPFTQKFFMEISSWLLLKDASFKEQVIEFFKKPDQERLSCTVYRYEDLSPIDEDIMFKDKRWPYTNVDKPNLYHLNDPIIQFILNQQVNSVIIDDTKMQYLCSTTGFAQPNSEKKLKDQFIIPFSSILTNSLNSFPDIQSLKELCAAHVVHSTIYGAILLLLEIERLAHELEDTMVFQEFIDLLAMKEVDLRLGRGNINWDNNFNVHFEQLKLKVLKRALTSNDVFCLVKDYRLALAFGIFDELVDLRNEFQTRIQSMLPLLPAEDKETILRELFKPEVFLKDPYYKETRNFDKKYDGYLPDPEFRSWAIDQYSDVLAAKHGQDSFSHTIFNEETRNLIDALLENTIGFSQFSIMSSLATKVNAQKDLAYYMKAKVKHYSVKDALSNRYTSIVAELFMNQCAKDKELRQAVIDFLTKPLTKDSTKPLYDHIQAKYSSVFQTCGFIDEYNQEFTFTAILRDYHRNFRAASLEIKTVYLETLLFPIGSSEAQQKEIITKIINQIFPPELEDSSAAHMIVIAYLNAADIEERRILSTALFVANIQEEGTKELSLGQKLNIVLSNMGPAGGKLLQAIHSHPQTPNSMKSDLAHCKTEFSKPLRWDVVAYVDNSGLLVETPGNPNPVREIGTIVGAGSFGITVFNTLSDGIMVADTFLREHAAIVSEREFTMMLEASKEIVKQKPSFSPITNMVEEAKRSAIAETDMSLAQDANTLAEKAYEHIKLVQIGDFQFTHAIAGFIGRGEGFKRISIAHGTHFNDLAHTAYKQAIAKAMIVTQLSLRLAGMNTDLDRHGGNIKVEGNLISHFDFGAMNLAIMSQEDKRVTGKVFAQALYAVVVRGEVFSDALLVQIQNAQVSDAGRIYLNGLNKELLALGDYFNTMDANDLPGILAYCLRSETMDSQIKTAFREELGTLAPAFELGLRWKAFASGVKIITAPQRVTTSTQPAPIISGAKSSNIGLFQSGKELNFDNITKTQIVNFPGAKDR